VPIVGAATSSIYRSPSATVELGGHLFLGWAPNKGRRPWKGGIPTAGRAVLGLADRSSFSTGGWVVFCPGCVLTVHNDASLHVGEESYVNFAVRILCHDRIRIGPSTAIGWETLIMDSDQHHLATDRRWRSMTAPVTIGAGVWIGARCTILKGVTIGDGAVVAAGSVVTTDVPAGCLAKGNPAEVVATDVSWR